VRGGDDVSLFVCEECRTIENTALSDFWLRNVDGGKGRALCSACDPDIGKWHGRFERRTYDGSQVVQWVDGRWVGEVTT
jgi:hypothetical protein